MSHVRNTDTTMSKQRACGEQLQRRSLSGKEREPGRQRGGRARDEQRDAEPAIADQDLLAECGERLRDEREQGQSHRDEVSEEDRSRILAQVRVVLVAEQAQVDRYGYEEEASLSSARGT